jgi:hypothetical protein
MAKGSRPRRLLTASSDRDVKEIPFAHLIHINLEKTMNAADLLRRLCNDLPMPLTIAALGRAGPPAKISEGYVRFLCPRCGEMRATVNPRNNLAHCFCCAKNLNNIDLLLTLDYDFRAAGALLERWLKDYQAPQTTKKTPPAPTRT